MAGSGKLKAGTMVEWLVANWIPISVLAVFACSLLGFFITKGAGFGPYNTSTLVLILVLFVAAMGFFTRILPEGDFGKILFALIGFSAGLFTGSGSDRTTKPKARKTTKPDEKIAPEPEAKITTEPEARISTDDTVS